MKKAYHLESMGESQLHHYCVTLNLLVNLSEPHDLLEKWLQWYLTWSYGESYCTVANICKALSIMPNTEITPKWEPLPPACAHLGPCLLNLVITESGLHGRAVTGFSGGCTPVTRKLLVLLTPCQSCHMKKKK